MATRRFMILAGAACLAGGSGLLSLRGPKAEAASGEFPVAHSDAEWRERLTRRQYAILRGHGTEAPHSSPLNAEKRRGAFVCAGCEAELFSSATKYDSRTGWPSFWAPVEGAVGEKRDLSYGMVRTEVHCARCGGHLGHVFDDGPRPTGLRYCINGDALSFKPTEE